MATGEGAGGSEAEPSPTWKTEEIMQVLLTRYRRIKAQGDDREILHNAGEVIEVKNKKLALQLCKDGWAEPYGADAMKIPGGVGVLATHKVSKVFWAAALELPVRWVKDGQYTLPFAYTVLWDPRTKPVQRYVHIALKILSRTDWDIGCVIRSYVRGKLACNIGSDEERARTKKIIKDLRIPYYRPGLIFIKRNERTQAFIECFQKERLGNDQRLSLLRALFITKPFLWALPAHWVAR